MFTLIFVLAIISRINYIFCTIQIRSNFVNTIGQGKELSFGISNLISSKNLDMNGKKNQPLRTSKPNGLVALKYSQTVFVGETWHSKLCVYRSI